MKTIVLSIIVSVAAAQAGAESLEKVRQEAFEGFSNPMAFAGNEGWDYTFPYSVSKKGKDPNLMTEGELMFKMIELTGMMDGESLAEANTLAETAVAMARHAQIKLPGSNEYRLLTPIAKLGKHLSDRVKRSGLTPEKRALPGFQYDGNAQQAVFFSLIDAFFTLPFSVIRSEAALPVDDTLLAEFSLAPDAVGLIAVLKCVGENTSDPELKAVHKKGADEARIYADKYAELDKELKIVRKIYMAK